MDLGLSGRKALVTAASAGLGQACALALAREGVRVTITGRTESTLIATAFEIETKTGNPISWAVADVTTDNGRAASLAACPDPDILINNGGGPPHGGYLEWSAADWRTAVESTLIPAIEMTRAVTNGMAGRGFGRIVNITSRTVKSALPGLGLSTVARAGLTGFVAGAAREVAGQGVTINNILPGPFKTARTIESIAHAAQRQGRPAADIAAERETETPAGRFGDPMEIGDACAFLCSAQAGYITGQNWLIDGGWYPGML